MSKIIKKAFGDNSHYKLFRYPYDDTQIHEEDTINNEKIVIRWIGNDQEELYFYNNCLTKVKEIEPNLRVYQIDKNKDLVIGWKRKDEATPKVELAINGVKERVLTASNQEVTSSTILHIGDKIHFAPTASSNIQRYDTEAHDPDSITWTKAKTITDYGEIQLNYQKVELIRIDQDPKTPFTIVNNSKANIVITNPYDNNKAVHTGDAVFYKHNFFHATMNENYVFDPDNSQFIELVDKSANLYRITDNNPYFNIKYAGKVKIVIQDPSNYNVEYRVADGGLISNNDMLPVGSIIKIRLARDNVDLKDMPEHTTLVSQTFWNTDDDPYDLRKDYNVKINEEEDLTTIILKPPQPQPSTVFKTNANKYNDKVTVESHINHVTADPLPSDPTWFSQFEVVKISFKGNYGETGYKIDSVQNAIHCGEDYYQANGAECIINISEVSDYKLRILKSTPGATAEECGVYDMEVQNKKYPDGAILSLNKVIRIIPQENFIIDQDRLADLELVDSNMSSYKVTGLNPTVATKVAPFVTVTNENPDQIVIRTTKYPQITLSTYPDNTHVRLDNQITIDIDSPTRRSFKIIHTGLEYLNFSDYYKVIGMNVNVKIAPKKPPLQIKLSGPNIENAVYNDSISRGVENNDPVYEGERIMFKYPNGFTTLTEVVGFDVLSEHPGYRNTYIVKEDATEVKLTWAENGKAHLNNTTPQIIVVSTVETEDPEAITDFPENILHIGERFKVAYFYSVEHPENYEIKATNAKFLEVDEDDGARIYKITGANPTVKAIHKPKNVTVYIPNPDNTKYTVLQEDDTPITDGAILKSGQSFKIKIINKSCKYKSDSIIDCTLSSTSHYGDNIPIYTFKIKEDIAADSIVIPPPEEEKKSKVMVNATCGIDDEILLYKSKASGEQPIDVETENEFSLGTKLYLKLHKYVKIDTDQSSGIELVGEEDGFIVYKLTEAESKFTTDLKDDVFEIQVTISESGSAEVFRENEIDKLESGDYIAKNEKVVIKVTDAKYVPIVNDLDEISHIDNTYKYNVNANGNPSILIEDRTPIIIDSNYPEALKVMDEFGAIELTLPNSTKYNFSSLSKAIRVSLKDGFDPSIYSFTVDGATATGIDNIYQFNNPLPTKVMINVASTKIKLKIVRDTLNDVRVFNETRETEYNDGDEVQLEQKLYILIHSGFTLDMTKTKDIEVVDDNTHLYKVSGNWPTIALKEDLAVFKILDEAHVTVRRSDNNAQIHNDDTLRLGTRFKVTFPNTYRLKGGKIKGAKQDYLEEGTYYIIEHEVEVDIEERPFATINVTSSLPYTLKALTPVIKPIHSVPNSDTLRVDDLFSAEFNSEEDRINNKFVVTGAYPRTTQINGKTVKCFVVSETTVNLEAKPKVVTFTNHNEDVYKITKFPEGDLIPTGYTGLRIGQKIKIEMIDDGYQTNLLGVERLDTEYPNDPIYKIVAEEVNIFGNPYPFVTVNNANPDIVAISKKNDISKAITTYPNSDTIRQASSFYVFFKAPYSESTHTLKVEGANLIDSNHYTAYQDISVSATVKAIPSKLKLEGEVAGIKVTAESDGRELHDGDTSINKGDLIKLTFQPTYMLDGAVTGAELTDAANNIYKITEELVTIKVKCKVKLKIVTHQTPPEVTVMDPAHMITYHNDDEIEVGSQIAILPKLGYIVDSTKIADIELVDAGQSIYKIIGLNPKVECKRDKIIIHIPDEDHVDVFTVPGNEQIHDNDLTQQINNQLKVVPKYPYKFKNDTIVGMEVVDADNGIYKITGYDVNIELEELVFASIDVLPAGIFRIKTVRPPIREITTFPNTDTLRITDQFTLEFKNPDDELKCNVEITGATLVSGNTYQVGSNVVSIIAEEKQVTVHIPNPTHVTVTKHPSSTPVVDGDTTVKILDTLKIIPEEGYKVSTTTGLEADPLNENCYKVKETNVVIDVELYPFVTINNQNTDVLAVCTTNNISTAIGTFPNSDTIRKTASFYILYKGTYSATTHNIVVTGATLVSGNKYVADEDTVEVKAVPKFTPSKINISGEVAGVTVKAVDDGRELHDGDTSVHVDDKITVVLKPTYKFEVAMTGVEATGIVNEYKITDSEVNIKVVRKVVIHIPDEAHAQVTKVPENTQIHNNDDTLSVDSQIKIVAIPKWEYKLKPVVGATVVDANNGIYKITAVDVTIEAEPVPFITINNNTQDIVTVYTKPGNSGRITTFPCSDKVHQNQDIYVKYVNEAIQKPVYDISVVGATANTEEYSYKTGVVDITVSASRKVLSATIHIAHADHVTVKAVDDGRELHDGDTSISTTQFITIVPKAYWHMKPALLRGLEATSEANKFMVIDRAVFIDVEEDPTVMINNLKTALLKVEVGAQTLNTFPDSTHLHMDEEFVISFFDSSLDPKYNLNVTGATFIATVGNNHKYKATSSNVVVDAELKPVSATIHIIGDANIDVTTVPGGVVIHNGDTSQFVGNKLKIVPKHGYKLKLPLTGIVVEDASNNIYKIMDENVAIEAVLIPFVTINNDSTDLLKVVTTSVPSEELTVFPCSDKVHEDENFIVSFKLASNVTKYDVIVTGATRVAGNIYKATTSNITVKAEAKFPPATIHIIDGDHVDVADATSGRVILDNDTLMFVGDTITVVPKSGYRLKQKVGLELLSKPSKLYKIANASVTIEVEEIPTPPAPPPGSTTHNTILWYLKSLFYGGV